jgi:fluoride exporter
MTLALIALAAAAGAASRFLLDRLVASRSRGRFPWGTFAVNVSGSLALGVLVGLALVRAVDGAYVVVLGTGYLGAYTTFSTWMVETVRLAEGGAWRAAIWNLVGSMAAGTAAAALGLGAGMLVP